MTTVDARYVLNTLAVRPLTMPEKYLFTCLEVMSWKISSLGFLSATSSARLSRNCTSWSTAGTVSCHRTLSFPRKSNLIAFWDIRMCSFLSVVAPTVSASSDSFSSPTLMAVRYIR